MNGSSSEAFVRLLIAARAFEKRAVAATDQSEAKLFYEAAEHLRKWALRRMPRPN
jgi:hypothetical protein